MASKVRYMKLRGNRWFFQLSVPERHRAWVGFPVVQKSLETSDRAIAQLRADALALEWHDRFARADKAPENVSEAFQQSFELMRHDLDKLRARSADRGEIEEFAGVVLDGLLEREATRLGYSSPSEIEGDEVSREFAAAHAGASAAAKGLTSVPLEFRRPFSALARAYLQDRQRPSSADHLSPQTLGQMEAVYRLFSDHIQDAPFATVSLRTATAFFDKIKRLMSTWGRSPKTKGRSLDDLLAISSVTPGPRLSDRTLFRYMVALSQVWEWARKREEVTGDNPFRGQVKKGDGGGRKSEKNDPWTEGAIRAYFDAHPDRSVRGKPDPFYWLPRIALLSGMRLNEICSLTAKDIKDADGVVYFDIVEGKTSASTRVVPVHRELAPFLTVVPKSGYLFPDLPPGGPEGKRSWHIGKRLGRQFRAIVGTTTFHSFRKSVATALDRSGARETDVAEILGHGKKGITFGLYSKGLTITQKRELIGRLALPSECQ